MYLFYCDESNLQRRPGDFFVYGGVVVPSDSALQLSNTIDRLRTDAGVPQDFNLKFNPCPPNIGHEHFTALKQSILEAAVQVGCNFIVSMILHDVATGPDDARRNEINRVCYHFDCLMAQRDSYGLVLIDRFDDRQIDAHLRDKFSAGITGLPYSPRLRLRHTLGFHYSAIGQSHFSSLVDIAIGSLRYAINVYTREQSGQLDAAQSILEILSPLFLREDTKGLVPEWSLFFSPKVVKVSSYRERYEALRAFLETSGIQAAQPITDQRRY